MTDNDDNDEHQRLLALQAEVDLLFQECIVERIQQKLVLALEKQYAPEPTSADVEALLAADPWNDQEDGNDG